MNVTTFFLAFFGLPHGDKDRHRRRQPFLLRKTHIFSTYFLLGQN